MRCGPRQPWRAGIVAADRLDLVRVFILAFLEDSQREAAMSRTTTMTVRISGALTQLAQNRHPGVDKSMG
jgi:hypothetical protein